MAKEEHAGCAAPDGCRDFLRATMMSVMSVAIIWRMSSLRNNTDRPTRTGTR